MRPKVNVWLVKKCLKVYMNNNSKELLFDNPNLVAVLNGKEFIFDTDNQFLYLYPLNIIDYVKAVQKHKPIKLVVKDFQSEQIENVLNYVNNVMDIDNNVNRLIEFEIQNYPQNLSEVYELFKNIYNRNIKITLNFKSLSCIKNYIPVFKFVNSLKISIFDCKNAKKQLKNLKTFKQRKEQFLFAKIYLNLKQIDEYYSFVKQLKALCFDYVLFTKVLLPKGMENVSIDGDVKYKLHKIKHDFEDKTFKIKLVKDLSTLYYPLFTLDSRNTKHCYASKVCNYLIDGKLYPCATRQILKDNVLLEEEKSKDYIGTKCLDCASIFENDYIDKILSTKFDRLEFKAKFNDINPLGIGTFKFKSNYNQIKNNFIIGQNLVDCNLAYNNGKTLKTLAKYIRKEKNVFLYCKLYKTIFNIEDIEKQVDEYLSLLKVRTLNVVSIHSLDILKGVNLIEVYKELKRLQNLGKIQHLGLCNTSKEQLEEVINSSINIFSFEGVYNLFCKYYENCGVLDFCLNKNIKFIAYQPLLMGEYATKQNTLLIKLSEKYNKTIPQILLNYYILHKKMCVLTKSCNINHIIENSNYDFYIEDRDYLKLDKENNNKVYNIDFNNEKNKIYLLSYKELREDV